MGFFSNLFNRHSQDDDEDEIEEEWEEEDSSESSSSGGVKSLRLPKLTEGMSLDVSLEENGEPLLSGQITSNTSKGLTLERKPGQLAFPMRERGTLVTMRGYGSDTAPFDLMGAVEESTRLKMVIKDIRAVTHGENRQNFRVFLNTPMTMYYEEDKDMENPEQCTLINISTGGACVQSEYIHGEGEVLRLKIQIEPYAAMTFLSEVIRVDEPKPGVFRYGMLFAKLNTQENSILTRMLFNIQVGDTGKKRAGTSSRS